MVKLRLSSIDAKAAIDEVRSQAVGLRLMNIYDLSPRVYLMKFGHGERKVYVLFESGVRLHVTNYSRDKPKVPSQFTLKLRKHVRSWRLDSVTQFGTDRVVDMAFGSGENQFHFILELYGQGNFALTDSGYSIMMLLRSAKQQDVRLAVRERYPVEQAQQFRGRTKEEILAGLTAAKPTDTLRASLPFGFYGTLLGDHMLASCGLNPNEKKRVWADDIAGIGDSVSDVCRTVDALFLSEVIGAGVLVRLHGGPRRPKEPPSSTSQAPEPAAAGDEEMGTPSASGATLPADEGGRRAQPGQPNAPQPQQPAPPVGDSVEGTPDEFWPECVLPFLDRSRIAALERTPSFSEAADRSFRATEQEKVEAHNVKKEQVAVSKRDRFLREHQKRIDNLSAEQERNRQIAELIQAHVDDIDAAINLVNDALATGISWDKLGSVIRLRQSEGTYPVANIIHNLKLHKNQISVLLEQECEEDEEDADLEPMIVDVDIGLNAFRNASRYFTAKKAVANKLTRTIQATEKGAAAAERHGERQAKKVIEKKDITAIRKPMWFEKFHWFLTSYGHVVVSGRDPMQADLLFRRYVAPGDVWVHADAQNCIPCVVKNPSNDSRIPMPSVEEAGIMCVARTDAWRRNTISAWWCLGHQVTKRAATGDHLGLGLFHVRGAKSYMPAMQLQLAVGLLFRTPDNKRPDRGSSGVACINVPEILQEEAHRQEQQALDQQQQQQQQQQAAGHSTSDGSRQSSGELPVSEGQGSGKTRSTLRHLQRGKGSSHAQGAGGSDGSGGCDARTISVVSTRTGATSRRGPSKGESPLACASGDSMTADEPPSGGFPDTPILAQPQLNKHQLSKLRKIKKRYAEQDEEDRRQAMSLLGHTSVSKVHTLLKPTMTDSSSTPQTPLSQTPAAQQQRPPQQQAVAQRPAAATMGETDTGNTSQEGGAGSGEDAGGADDSAEDDPSSSLVLAAAAEGGEASSGRVRFAADPNAKPSTPFDEAAMAREHEEMNRRASSFDDDTAKAMERVAAEYAEIVPFLDGCPTLHDDLNITDVVLVCAPLASIRHYTFKCRIAPGTEKKGHAANQIFHAFIKQLTPRVPQAASLLKALGIDGVVCQVPGMIKVHLQETDTAPPSLTSSAAGGPLVTAAVAAAAGSAAGSSSGTSPTPAAPAGTSSSGIPDPVQPTASGGGGLSARQKAKIKKEAHERQIMERLRAERRARQQARAEQHVDPAAA